MRHWFKFAGIAAAGLFFVIVYVTLVGPLLAAAFMASCFLAALAIEALRRQVVRGPHDGATARVLKIFAVFLIIGIVLEQRNVDSCLDAGGSWNWYSVACRHS